MSITYILENDLLKHLPYADAAVNLTTEFGDWKFGLAKAYSEKFPKVYDKFKKDQIGLKVKLAEPNIYKTKKDEPDIICLSLRSSNDSKNDLTTIKKGLKNLAEACKDYHDVIMPIIITGTLKESLELMDKYLGKSKTMFYVGIAPARAEKEKLPDIERLTFISPEKTIDSQDPRIKNYLLVETYIPGRPDVYISTGGNHFYGFRTKDFKDEKRMSHWTDTLVALPNKNEANVPFNQYVMNIPVAEGDKLNVKFL